MTNAAGNPIREVRITRWWEEPAVYLLTRHLLRVSALKTLLLQQLLCSPSCFYLSLLPIVNQECQGTSETDNDEHFEQTVVDLFVEEVVCYAWHVLRGLVGMFPVICFVGVGVVGVGFDEVI